MQLVPSTAPAVLVVQPLVHSLQGGLAMVALPPAEYRPRSQGRHRDLPYASTIKGPYPGEQTGVRGGECARSVLDFMQESACFMLVFRQWTARDGGAKRRSRGAACPLACARTRAREYWRLASLFEFHGNGPGSGSRVNCATCMSSLRRAHHSGLGTFA